jgi:hypothetical protein
MEFLIHKIDTLIPEDYPFIFCDANVWITTLKYFGSIGVDYNEQPYQDFIEAIINLNNEKDPVISKKIKNRPKIVLTSILLSEIINAYMRNVAMKAFFGGDDTYKAKNYKNDYRDNSKSDFEKKLSDLCSDICAFQDYTCLMDDSFKSINPYSFLPKLCSYHADFNDVYYFHFLLHHKMPFITHDKDCKFNDIIIGTNNKSLLSYSTV